MSNTPKVHYPRVNSYGKNVMCGTAATFTTEVFEKITCLKCKKLAEKLIAWRQEDAGADGEYGRNGYYG